QIYKEKNKEGFKGGPSYYIQKAMGQRWLGVVFAVLLIATFAYGFNSLQANTIVSSLSYYFGGEYETLLIPSILGLILSGVTAYIIYGGQDKITFITSIIVPIMALMYLFLGLIVTFKNFSAIPSVIKLIFENAFDFEAIFGAFAGSAVILGIKRGLFSNEAGMGSAPNAAAAADVSHPIKQGAAQMLSVFIDTLLICSTTAFIILLSGVDITKNSGMPLVQQAISTQFGNIGILFITISVLFFAFSSIIGNYYYTESNMLFILNKDSSLKIFKLTSVIAVFIGSIVGSDFVWNLADVLMGFMAIINILVILILSKKVKIVLDDYKMQKKANKNPEFVNNGRIDNIDCW
ncbi:MAG: alanine/glycine:cation symporter family protein, partial [Oscillospiraceae bacterium]